MEGAAPAEMAQEVHEVQRAQAGKQVLHVEQSCKDHACPQVVALPHEGHRP